MTSQEEFLKGGGFTVEQPVTAEQFLGGGSFTVEGPDVGAQELDIDAPALEVGLPENQAPVPAALTAEEVLGLDPEVKNRRSLFPVGEGPEGDLVLATPELAISLADEVLEVLALPKRITQGHVPTNEEILNFTAMVTPGVPSGTSGSLRTARGAAAPTREAAEAAAQETAETAAKATAREAADTGGILSRRLRSTAVPAERLRDISDDAAAKARTARFEDLDIPATRADVTQDFAHQAEQARLVAITGDRASEPLRQMRLRQSEVFTQRVDELVESLGVPDDTGARIKDALSGRIEVLRADKNRLYKEVADAAPEVINTPLFVDEIVKAVPDREAFEQLRDLMPTQAAALDNILVRYGIDADPKKIETLTERGREVTPLTLGNFDDFRKSLNAIDRADQTGTVGVSIGPIRRALDEEAGFIDSAIREAGITDQGVVNTLNEARARVRQLKTEFSPQSITGRLAAVKRDGVTPVIEASKVSNELLRPGAPIENLERTLTSLRQSGKKGSQAIGDLQASVVTDALDAAFKAPSRKTSGIETIGGNQFAKALDKFGADKLDLLFKNNKEALKRLRDLKQTGLDITPTAGAVPKGSAAVLLDRINSILSFPGAAAVRDVFKFAVEAGGDERAVRRAMDATGARGSPLAPAARKLDDIARLMRQYPGISARLGLTATRPTTKDLPTLESLEDTA